MMKASAAEIAKMNANSRTVIFPGIGHGAPLAELMLFNRTLDAWLSGSETFHSG